MLEFCLGQLEEKCDDLEINKDSIMIIVKYAMEIVELTEMKGSEQKNMVENLIKSIIEKKIEDEEIKNIYLKLIENGTLGTTIDLIVDASKGKLLINKDMKKKIKRFCCI